MFRSIFLVAVIRGCAAFGPILLTLILARSGGPELVGIFMVAYSLILGVAVLTRGGLDNVILRLGGIAWHRGLVRKFKGIVADCTRIALALSVTAALLLYLGAASVADALLDAQNSAQIIRLSALAIPAIVVGFCASAALKASDRSQWAPLSEPPGIALVTVTILLLVRYIFGQVNISGVLAVFLACGFSVALFATWRARRADRGTETSDALSTAESTDRERSLLAQGAPFLVMAAVSYAGQWSGPLILSAFVSAADIGVYSAAQSLSMAVGFFLAVVSGIVAPKFAAYCADGDQLRLQKLVGDVCSAGAAIMLPVALALVIWGDVVLSVYGNGFSRGHVWLITLVVAQFVSVSAGPVAYLLAMGGQAGSATKVMASTGAANIILGFTLAPIMGVWGVVIATTVAIIVQNTILVHVAWRRLEILSLPRPVMFLKRLGRSSP